MEQILSQNGEKVLRKTSGYLRLELNSLFANFNEVRHEKEVKSLFIVSAGNYLNNLDIFLYTLNGMDDITAEERLFIRRKLYEIFNDYVEGLY